MKPRILFMIDSLPGGGAEKVLIYILNQIDRSKFDVDLLLINKLGIYLSSIPSDINCFAVFGDGQKMKSIGLYPLFRLYRRIGTILFRKYPALISKFIKLKHDYDIGISFCQGDNTVLLREKKNCFRSRVSWIHTDMTKRLSSEKEFPFWKGLSDIDGFFFVSQEAESVYLSFFPDNEQLKQKTRILYNPIDSITIRDQAQQASEMNKNNSLRIVAVGLLSHSKRFDRLINIHKRLLDDGIMQEVYILGEGMFRKELEIQIKELGVEDSCRLMGFQNPYPYINAADIFVSSSEQEGMPLVVAEAMVLCKPIVSTSITGPTEMLEDGKYGLLTENNEEALFQGIKKMLTDKNLREHYINELKNNQNKFIFNSSVENIENALIDIINK